MAGFKDDISVPINNLTTPLLVSDNTLKSAYDSEKNNDDNEEKLEEEVEYPFNTKPLQNQVAGHAFKDGKRTVGMLKHNDGYVLKPVNQPVQGEKEIKFYEKIQEVIDPLLIEFKSFIPEYYGTTVLDFQGKKVTFLLLRDITNGFSEPCIMDVKIGKQTWEPSASEEKQQSEQKKYAKCKENLCFCIPGFQTYDFKTGKFQKYGKDYGKKLDVSGVYDALKKFSNADHGIGEYVLTPILSKLREMLNWWKKQHHFHIYASSILLAYDAATVRKNLCNKSDTVNNTLSNHVNYIWNSNHELTPRNSNSGLESWVCVYLIDFAHVIPAEKNSLDFNYISGLESLINVFENLFIEFQTIKNDENSSKNSVQS